MSRRFTIVRVALGSLLLLAAGLKLYGLSVSAIPRVGWFSQPWVQLAAAEWEVILGLWLLSGSYVRGAWLAALGTFAAFAAVSGYLGWIGVASCGCFGVIRASPWWAFGVDVAAVVLLFVSFPRTLSSAVDRPASGLIIVSGVAGASIGLLALVGAWYYGSIEGGLARLRGDPLFVEPSYVAFEDATPGAIVKRSVRVHNFSAQSIHLIGGTSDCSCATTSGLPVAVPSGGYVDLPIRLGIPDGANGQFTRSAEFWTDSGQMPVVRLTLGCRVKSGESDP